MKRYAKHKVIILILLIVVLVESILLFYLWFSRPKKIVPEKPRLVKGKIAIVIDDWGYNLNHLNIVNQIKYSLTISVLPNLSYSSVVAEKLYKRGFEIILHLPLEPREKLRLEKNTILTVMDDSSVINILKKDLQSVPNAVGVSSHMGSKATQDSRLMAILFKEFKKRHLYFLDSFVSAGSVCSDLARKMDISFARRDVFLDNKEDPEYIKGQIYKVKNLARSRGWAVAIGHDRKVTLEVLKEAMPALEKEGYKFVFVSELVR